MMISPHPSPHQPRAQPARAPCFQPPRRCRTCRHDGHARPGRQQHTRGATRHRAASALCKQPLPPPPVQQRACGREEMACRKCGKRRPSKSPRARCSLPPPLTARCERPPLAPGLCGCECVSVCAHVSVCTYTYHIRTYKQTYRQTDKENALCFVLRMHAQHARTHAYAAQNTNHTYTAHQHGTKVSAEDDSNKQDEARHHG